jgi:hypothetical protein
MRPVFMGCCKLDIGAHHACWLLLQALFMTASVPRATNTTATKAITRGGLHSGLTPPATHWLNFRPSNMNLQENVCRTQSLLRRTKISDAAFCLPPRENTKAVMLDFVDPASPARKAGPSLATTDTVRLSRASGQHAHATT